MSRVIIADVRSHISGDTVRGHGFAVASNYLSVFRDVAEVKVAGGPVYCQKYGDNSLELPHDTNSFAPAWLNKIRVILNMRRLFRLCRKDTVVMQSSGVVTAFVGLILFKPAETRVFMILYNEEALNSRIKRLIYRFAKRKISGILCPNEKIGKAHSLPYCVVPDYIYCGDGDTRHTKTIPYADKKYDFCMVGLIWRDKGMVEAARHLAKTSCRVLIAGSLSGEEGLEDDLRSACNGAENIELRLGYLSEEEYDDAIRNSRYCILNYSGAYSKHSSGVVFDILFRGVPVIGRKCSTLDFIGEYDIGSLFDNVKEFEPSAVLQETAHANFLKNLQSYFAIHNRYKKKLIQFVLK